MSRVLITGASGHVGNTLCRVLLKQGHSVRTLMRTRDPESLRGLDIEMISGDITEKKDIASSADNVDVVIHAAAKISIIPGNLAYLRKVNVQGTANVIELCKARGIRLVYVSSIEAIGDPDPGNIVDERFGFDPDKAMIDYGRSKAEAAVLVKEAVEDGLDAVGICPVGVAGPNDYRPSQIGTMIMNFSRKRLPAYPDFGGFDWVDVRDVADGLIAAWEKGKSGEFYILSGGHLFMSEMMMMLRNVTGVKPPGITMSYPVMRAVGFLAEPFYRLTGMEPVITRGSARILKSNMVTSSRKAREDLGFSPRPLEETFRDHYEWLKDHFPK